MMKLLAVLAALFSFASMTQAQGEYRHFVFFKFKEGTPPKEVKRIEQEFAALPTKIATITGFEWGINISPENKAKGFTHGFMVTFKDKKGLEIYIPHTDHEAFVKGLLPHLEDVFVFDFQHQ